MGVRVPPGATVVFFFVRSAGRRHKKMRSPGIEPGSITWQATIITTRPRTRFVITTRSRSGLFSDALGAPLTQSVEYWSYEPKVVGSSPTWSNPRFEAVSSSFCWRCVLSCVVLCCVVLCCVVLCCVVLCCVVLCYVVLCCVVLCCVVLVVLCVLRVVCP